MISIGNTIFKNRARSDESAVSETVGYIILLGIVVAGLSIIVLMNQPAVSSSQDNAEFSSIEQSFTTADSRISKARFSTSISQETPFMLNEGSIVVDGSGTNSYLEIFKENLDMSNRIYWTPLGTIKCVTDHGEVAYQDGGVWESFPDGGSIMISPPDFDYNGETLTLPIMHIVGDDSLATSAGGSVLIDVKSAQQPETIYPKGSGTNPVEQGKDIIIRIKSDYYQAWADFINERTRATATVDPANKMVTATLKTGTPTQSGLIDSGMNTLHMETTNEYAPITKFTVHLEKRNPGKDYYISLHPPTVTDPYLEIETDRLHGPGKEYVALVFKYTDLTHGIYEAFSTKLEFDSSTEYNTLDIDMLSQVIQLNYGDDDGDGYIDSTVNPTSATWGTNEYQRGGDDGTFPGITNGNDVSVINGGTKTLSDVTQHYLRLMSVKFPDDGPIYNAYGTEKGNNNQHIHYDPSQSTFLLQFTSKQDLKYLYVTKGNIDVKLASTG